MNFGDWICFPCWFTIEIFQRSRMVTAACSMWCRTVYRPPCLSTEPKPPPQDKTRAKSFPVPAGRIATGGGETKFCLSIAFKTQPTVPSPPHTRILKCGTFLNKYRPTSGPCVELSSKTCITIRKMYSSIPSEKVEQEYFLSSFGSKSQIYCKSSSFKILMFPLL